MQPGADSAVREAAGLARRRHADLAARAQRLQERLRGAADVTKQYHDALERAQRWMKEVRVYTFRFYTHTHSYTRTHTHTHTKSHTYRERERGGERQRHKLTLL